MKKLIIGFLSTFFLLVFIWFVIGFITHGDSIFDKHLNFKYSINNILDIFKFNINDLLNTLESFKEINDFEGNFLEEIGMFFDTIIIKPINLGLDILHLLLDLIVAIVKFVFFPKFI